TAAAAAGGQQLHRHTSTQTMTQTPPPANICLTKDCVRLAANYLNNMNPDVKPCDDFYEFACGRYSNSKVIPEHEKKVTVLSEMTSGLNRHLKRILEGTRDKNESTPLNFARSYYESCMDNSSLEELDLLPLNTLISRLGGWSLLTNSRFDSAHFQWELLAGHNAVLGRSGLFHLFVHKSFARSDENMIMFAPPRLLLEKKKFYDVAPFDSNEYIQKYRVYMIEFLELLGADREALIPHVDNILQFEMLISNATKRDNIRNHTAINNVVKLGDFKRRHAKINWDLFLNDEIRSYLAPISEDTVVNVIDPGFFDTLTTLLTGNRMQIVNDFLMWRLISSFEEYLPRRFRQPGHKFRLWWRGSAEEPAWETCVRVIRTHMPAPLASAYAAEYFTAKDRDQAVEMIADLKVAMEHTLVTADWMDEATRTAAIAKLQQMGHKVGFPDWLFNQSHVMAPFDGVKLHAKRYFENAIALEKSQFKEMLSRLHSTNRGSTQEVWVSSIIAVDAFHYFNANEIIFPAGILQFPMFVRDAPAYVNYGAIGMGIGHEITHGYDDLGSQYDGTGNLRGWWRADTMRVFQNKKQCFIMQYGSKTEPVTGRKLDGRLTVGENIADNGGLRVAYGAYHLHAAARAQQALQEQRLPTFGNWTDTQMFFLAFANTWCEAVKPTALNYLLDTDVHSLGRFRVNVPLQNFPEFANAFEC
ncbi:hypothetical protein PFISCL1PPCAC_6947, partial [Pristionchus fissidentatus]